ncbi:MAG TPA: TIGR03435 family protein [Acidobacteriaceae bacterium]
MRTIMFAVGTLLLTLAGVLLLLAPSVHAQAAAAQDATPNARALAFDVVTIKRSHTAVAGPGIQSLPNGDSILLTNISPRLMLGFAYDVQLHDGIYGLPAWADSETYDVTAKVAASDLPAFRSLLPRQRNALLRPLLEDRFHLQFHRETRMVSGYALVVAKSGPRLDPNQPPADPDPGNIHTAPGSIIADYVPIAPLLDALAVQLGRPVVDRTGLTGRYTFALHFAWAQAAADTQPDAAPSLFTAIEEQLGLKLEPVKAPVPVLVVDHIEQPSEN